MTGISTVRRLTAGQLHATAPNDVMVISETRGGAIAAWSLDGGLAFAAADDYSGADCWLSVVGNPEATPTLVDAALADLGDQIAGLTVPLGVSLAPWNAAPPPGQEAESEWDLMATRTPPPTQEGESRIVPIDDLIEVQAFLDRVSPQHSVRADYKLVDLWAGVRDEASDSLLAIGAQSRRISGVAYLASIATDPQARGRGFGAAITAMLTRRVLDGSETLCTLAHYNWNDAARRVYLRVGYHTTHQFSSGHIRRQSE